jgi:outer membrane protein OmpA-like peptidoglycan-associated protein
MARLQLGKVMCLGSAGLLLGLSLSGCLATRGWVNEQMMPLANRLSDVEGRVSGVESGLARTEQKADRALASLDNLRLERRFVLNMKDGATFTYNSDALTAEAKQQIDGFFSDLENPEDKVFLVAGHTDSTGTEAYNYELGQKRADSVSRYLVSRRHIDPLRVTSVSYGESTPLADNATREGRNKNRRIEILVYNEAITTAARGAAAPR